MRRCAGGSTLLLSVVPLRSYISTHFLIIYEFMRPPSVNGFKKDQHAGLRDTFAREVYTKDYAMKFFIGKIIPKYGGTEGMHNARRGRYTRAF